MSSASTIRLITRGDDLGSFRAANRAVITAFQDGILRNSSIMVPTSYFEEAVHMVCDVPELCLGLHVTLTSEWYAPRWKPISPPEKVPSLVDSDGYFFPDTQSLFRNGARLDEMLYETRAQLEMARARGLKLHYIDDHMGTNWIFEDPDDSIRFSHKLQELARQEGLLWYQDLSCSPLGYTSVDDFCQRLKRLEAGTYLLVTHPADQLEELWNTIGGSYEQPGKVAQERLSDFQLLCHPSVVQTVREQNITLLRFDEYSRSSSDKLFVG